MHVISQKRLKEFWQDHPEAEQPLKRWYKITSKAEWQSLDDVRQDFPHADLVRGASGRTIILFNIAGNKYRLITAIHFDRRTAYALRVLTHVEYDKQNWRDEL